MRWPYLDLWIDFCGLQVSTSVMYERHESLTYEFITLRILLCKRWGFRVRLYEPRRDTR